MATAVAKVRKFSVRAGDLVQVMAGKDKGKQGKITRILLKTEQVMVDGVNVAKRHVRPSQQHPQGGIITKELPIHISNVMIVDPKTGKPTRVGKKLEKDKKSGKERWVRVAKDSGTSLEGSAK